MILVTVTISLKSLSYYLFIYYLTFMALKIDEIVQGFIKMANTLHLI